MMLVGLIDAVRVSNLSVGNMDTGSVTVGAQEWLRDSVGNGR